MGAVTPVGNSVQASLGKPERRLKRGIAPITQFDTANYKAKLAAEVRDFDPADYLERNDVLRTDRYAQFAVAAAQQAVEDSGIEETMWSRNALPSICGTGIGGIEHF